MNEDRIIGAGRGFLGEAKRGVGDATGSERLEGEGIVDQVVGAAQHGYGKVKDAASDIVDDAPTAIARTVERSRDLGRRGNDAIRDRLGDHGPLYLIGGAAALFALGTFAILRSTSTAKPKHSTGRRSRSAPKKPSTRSN